MSSDPTGTLNTAPALRLIVSSDGDPVDGTDDPTGTQNTAPALRLIVPPAQPGGYEPLDGPPAAASGSSAADSQEPSVVRRLF